MKKIAHFIDSNDPGGAETLIVEMCRYMANYGYVTEVYHFGNKWLEQRCLKYDVPTVLVPGYKYYKSVKTLPIFCIIFARFLRKRKVDILHSHLFDSITAASFSTFLSRIAHIGTLHDIYTIENNTIRAFALKISCLLGTRIVTVSEQIRSHLLKLGNMKPASIMVIKNGVDIQEFEKPTNKKLMVALGIKENLITFICVARMVEIKGHEVLIEAAKLLNNRNLGFKLLFVGDGSEKDKYIQLAKKYDLDKVIGFLGQRDDVPELLKISDCFVLSSRSEGLSCSIIEAMASGLPAIVTDVGGNRELIKDSLNGYVVPVDDVSMFAEKMEEMIADVNIRAKYGKASFELAKSKLSLETTISKYIECYTKF